MASILDKYGIKEVADVTFYEIGANGEPGAPVLFLDTLKVSTIEQTAEQTEARGGKGNPPLIIWDYGKEINVTLEDALFSAKSMAMMFGNGQVATSVSSIHKTIEFIAKASGTLASAFGSTYEINGVTHTIPEGAVMYSETGTSVTSCTKDDKYFVTFPAAISNQTVIEINANTFPGTYYITGDTWSRSYDDGKDSFFQFIIPKAKMSAENSITLEAEGDPSVNWLNADVKVA